MKSTLIPNIGEDSLQGKEDVSVGVLSLEMETGMQTAITLSLSFLLPLFFTFGFQVGGLKE